MNTENNSQDSGPSKASSSASSVVGKTLLILVILIAGAAGALYAAGGNEIRVVVTEDIESGDENLFQRRNKVYRLLTLPNYVMQWCEGLKSIEPEDEEAGHREGAKAKVTIEAGGKEIVFDEEIVLAQNEVETELKMTSDQMDLVQNFKVDYEAQDFDAATNTTKGIVTVTHTCKVKFKGLSRIMAVFSKSAMEQQMKSNLAKLKELAEDGDLVVKKPKRKTPPRQRRGGRNSWKKEKEKKEKEDAGKGNVADKSKQKSDEKSSEDDAKK